MSYWDFSAYAAGAYPGLWGLLGTAGCFCQLGLLFVSVLATRAPEIGACSGAPIFCKCSLRHFWVLLASFGRLMGNTGPGPSLQNSGAQIETPKR